MKSLKRSDSARVKEKDFHDLSTTFLFLSHLICLQFEAVDIGCFANWGEHR